MTTSRPGLPIRVGLISRRTGIPGAVGWDNLVYGTLLVLFIIFLPEGLLGSALKRLAPARA